MFGGFQEHWRCNFVSTYPSLPPSRRPGGCGSNLLRPLAYTWHVQTKKTGSEKFLFSGRCLFRGQPSVNLYAFESNPLLICFSHLCLTWMNRFVFFTRIQGFAEMPVFNCSNTFLATSFERSYLEINMCVWSGFESGPKLQPQNRMQWSSSLRCAYEF